MEPAECSLRKSTLSELVPITLTNVITINSDPLFQYTLTQVTRSNPQLFSPKAPSPSTTSWSGLPVIFDEVFTGLYRLGRRTAASFLGLHPDITVNAKLLTGGLLPLCTTMASNEIFDAFSSPEKSDALLHGHSYTAHAIGCTVAQKSLQTMMDMEQTGQWNPYQADWTSASPAAHTKPEDAIWSSWSHGLVRDLSFANSVEGLFAIGTVLSITLRDETGKGGSLLSPPFPLNVTILVYII